VISFFFVSFLFSSKKSLLLEKEGDTFFYFTEAYVVPVVDAQFLCVELSS
jgi:hypothetical protein